MVLRLHDDSHMLRTIAPLAIVVLVGTGFIDEKEFECEEAVQHLSDCCPHLERHNFKCETVGCNQEPDFSANSTRRILGKSCQTLASDGDCAAALLAAGQGGACNDAAQQIRTCCGFEPVSYSCNNEDRFFLTAASASVSESNTSCVSEASCELLLSSQFCNDVSIGHKPKVCRWTMPPKE